MNLPIRAIARLVCFLLLSSTAYGGPRVDFLIDIDHVILDRIQPSMGVVPIARTIEAMNTSFRLADGAEEFLESLAQIPGAKISFYSHASRERNLEVLAKIRLSSGRSALDVAEGRVLSHEDVIDTNKLSKEEAKLLQPDESIFAGQFKKDLRKIPDLDLEHAFLIDDTLGNVVKGQEKNLLWVEDKGELFGKPEDPTDLVKSLIKEKESEGLKDLGEAVVSDRNRLTFARGLIDEAMAKSLRDKITLSEALSKLQWTQKNGALYFNSARLKPDFYRRGARLFKKVNPNYHFTPLLKPTNMDQCSFQILQDLLQLKTDASGASK